MRDWGEGKQGKTYRNIILWLASLIRHIIDGVRTDMGSENRYGDCVEGRRNRRKRNMGLEEQQESDKKEDVRRSKNGNRG